ncbi:MAG: response regulator [Saprospiraceae bacterium]|uniref:Response regulator n=1 Tax=Candidatus Opimibacter skivensis TaxID=2982028 RepID=A0A9D7T0M2_9BACT|nr:response regulator [Candidatus Opimibacter skivensis]
MNAINILVVEDEALVAAMIKEALSKTKYSVRAVAFNKASAEKYLATEPIDAALLDINLEGNFEGIEIGRLIRDHHHIPFLYITAHADDQTLHNAKLTQPSGYIVKPFTERDLLAGLEIALYNFHQRQSPLFRFDINQSTSQGTSI